LQFNAAGQMTSLTAVRATWSGSTWVENPVTETRQYNVRGQMTRMTAPGEIDLEYRFSTTANDGRITQMKDWISGEELNYQYDSLGRLSSAVTTGPEWGNGFVFDGFGNLLQKTVTKGSAPALSIQVNGTTNRQVGVSYDANGNAAPGPYDVENRLLEASSGGGWCCRKRSRTGR
jgi:hypothetical protein